MDVQDRNVDVVEQLSVVLDRVAGRQEHHHFLLEVLLQKGEQQQEPLLRWADDVTLTARGKTLDHREEERERERERERECVCVCECVDPSVSQARQRYLLQARHGGDIRRIMNADVEGLLQQCKRNYIQTPANERQAKTTTAAAAAAARVTCAPF